MNKIRAYELAKECGVPSRDVMVKAEEFGIEISDYRANLSGADADRIRAAFEPLKERDGRVSKPRKEPDSPKAAKVATKDAATKDGHSKGAAPKAATGKAKPGRPAKGGSAAKPAAKAASAKATKAPATKAAAAKAPAAGAAKGQAAAGKAPRADASDAPVVMTRAYNLAKELGLPSKAVMDQGAKLGIEIRDHRQNLDPGQVSAIRDALIALGAKPVAQGAPAASGKKPAPAKGEASAKPGRQAAKKGDDSKSSKGGKGGKKKSTGDAPIRGLESESASEELALAPGKVIDLRGSNFKPDKADAKKGPQVGPVGAKAPVSVPPPGQVVDLRGGAKREEAPKPERPARSGRGRDAAAAQPADTRSDAELDAVAEVGNRIEPRGRSESGNRAESGGRRDRKGKRDRDDSRGRRSGRDRQPQADQPMVYEGLPSDDDLDMPDDTPSELPHKDISILIVANNAEGTIEAVIESVKSQKTPWETEILLLDRGSEDATLDLVAEHSDIRLVRTSARLPSGKALDTGFQECAGEIVVVITADLRPMGDDWLVRLTDPLFEDEAARMAVVDGSIVDTGESAPDAEPRTYRRGDKSDAASDLDGGFFAVRRRYARKKRFGSHRGDPRVWIKAILESGGERRVEPSIVAEKVEPKPTEARAERKAAPTKAPEFKSAPAEAKAEAPRASAPKHKPEPARKPEPAHRHEEPQPAAPEQEPIELWQVPAKIAARTAEKWVHIATGLEPRTLFNVLLAPVEAAREVLDSIK